MISLYNKWTVRMAMAAACAGALTLAGCESSTPTGEAQKASRDAAYFALSAGEPRATDKLLESVSAGTVTKDTDVKSGDVVTNTPDKDLAKALEILNKALTGDLPPFTKFGLQQQLGATQLQLAQYKYGLAQDDMAKINDLSLHIVALAAEAHSLMIQADAVGAGAPPASAASQAHALLTKRQQATADARKKVSDIQAQIAAKQESARRIYADTEIAFAAAEAMKGQESIDAGNKAMSDRKQAEGLTEEAGNLAPALAQAQADADLAKVAEDEAKKLADLADTNDKLGQETAKGIRDHVASLKDAASKIIGEGQPAGLSTQIKDFTALCNKLDLEIRDAASDADKAAASFKAAGATYITFTTEAKTKADNAGLDPKDPLRVVAKDERPQVLLAWSESAAKQLAGRLFLMGVQGASLAKDVSSLASAVKIDAGTTTLDAAASLTQAATRFSDAIDITSNADQRGAANGDADRIRWIGFALEATAYQGGYLADVAKAKTQDANERKLPMVLQAGRAIDRNPALASQLSWIHQ